MHSMTIGSRSLIWGERTYVMGILNLTPDSFSGDGLFVLTPGHSPGGRGEQGLGWNKPAASWLQVQISWMSAENPPGPAPSR